MIVTLFRRATLGLLAFGLWAGAPGAQSIVSTGQSFVSVDFLSGQQAADGSRLAGLRFRLKPGWKTYWRSPGEAGVPPVFDWSNSDNLDNVQIYWPRPEVFESFGVETIGYSQEVILPVRLFPGDASEPIGLSMTGEIGVCREMCVFEQIGVEREIVPAQPAEGVAVIEHYQNRVPAPGERVGLISAECAIEGSGKQRSLAVLLSFETPPGNPAVMIEGRDGMWIHSVTTDQNHEQISINAEIALMGEGAWVQRSDIRLTVLADAFAADIHGCKAFGG